MDLAGERVVSTVDRQVQPGLLVDHDHFLRVRIQGNGNITRHLMRRRDRSLQAGVRRLADLGNDRHRGVSGHALFFNGIHEIAPRRVDRERIAIQLDHQRLANRKRERTGIIQQRDRFAVCSRSRLGKAFKLCLADLRHIVTGLNGIGPVAVVLGDIARRADFLRHRHSKRAAGDRQNGGIAVVVGKAGFTGHGNSIPFAHVHRRTSQSVVFIKRDDCLTVLITVDCDRGPGDVDRDIFVFDLDRAETVGLTGVDILADQGAAQDGERRAIRPGLNVQAGPALDRAVRNGHIHRVERGDGVTVGTVVHRLDLAVPDGHGRKIFLIAADGQRLGCLRSCFQSYSVKRQAVQIAARIDAASALRVVFDGNILERYIDVGLRIHPDAEAAVVDGDRMVVAINRYRSLDREPVVVPSIDRDILQQRNGLAVLSVGKRIFRGLIIGLTDLDRIIYPLVYNMVYRVPAPIFAMIEQERVGIGSRRIFAEPSIPGMELELRIDRDLCRVQEILFCFPAWMTPVDIRINRLSGRFQIDISDYPINPVVCLNLRVWPP